MKLRLGLIGTSGDWDSRYLPAIRVLRDRFEVLGVYHAVSALAESAAKQLETDCYCSLRDLVAHRDVDAVMLLDDGWYGTVPVDAACAAGKAVYCGSEIHFATHHAEQLKSRVDRAGIAFMAEFPKRYAPATLRLKELIATRLGQPQLIFCNERLVAAKQISGSKKAVGTKEHFTGQSRRSQMLRMDRELMELIDWCCFVAGKTPSSVLSTVHVPQSSSVVGQQNKAKTNHASQGAEAQEDQSKGKKNQRSEEAANAVEVPPDYQSVTMEMTGDKAQTSEQSVTAAHISCGAYIQNSWREAHNFRPPAALQVSCEHGLAFLDLPNTLIWFDEAGRHQEALESEIGVDQQLLTQFHRAVTSLVRKMGDLEDVYSSLNTLQLAKQSALEGKRFVVEEM